MALGGAASVKSTSHLHGLDLNDVKCDWLSALPLWACDSLGAGLLIK